MDRQELQQAVNEHAAAAKARREYMSMIETTYRGETWNMTATERAEYDRLVAVEDAARMRASNMATMMQQSTTAAQRRAYDHEED